MFSRRDRALSKFLSIVLCLLIAAEAHFVFSQQETPLMRFASARKDYADGNYAAARQNLEAIVRVLDENRTDFRDFLGHVYVLLGACAEKLREDETARRHYRKALGLLGSGDPTIEGLSLGALPLLGEIFGGGITPPAREVLAETDDLTIKFSRVKEAYLSDNMDYARGLVETLLADLGQVGGRLALKGETYLLAGAIYESLKLKDLAVKYYCQAKTLLGEGKSFEGLNLRTLKYYGEPCRETGAAIAGRSVAGPARGRGGSLMGTVLKSLLVSALVGGLIYYLFFSKNGPFKKKSGDGNYSSSCFSTFWKFSVDATWSGAKGTITLTPDAYPNPTENNNWQDQVTYTLAATGGTLADIYMTMDLTIGGGDNGKRRDVVTVNGVVIFDQTNTFTEACSSAKKITFPAIYTRNSTGTFTIVHKVELSEAAAIGASMTVVNK